MRTALLLTLLACFACKRSEDEAAKKRIFSPEEPRGAAAEAKQAVDAQRLADPDVAERVLHMPQAEIAQRLPAHKAQTRVQFAWFRGPGLPDGGAEVSLSEETTLVENAAGDFSLRLANDRNQGFELVWSGGEVFVKSLFGPYRKRRTDRTDVNAIREQALSGLATFDRLAKGLKLQPAGEAQVEGRRAVRYTVAGSGTRPVKQPLAPANEYAGGKGPDPDTAKRQELWAREEPISVSGTVLVDAETAVPLGCELQGRFRVPGQAGDAAELDLHSTLAVSAVGRNEAIAKPAAEPEPSVPHAVKDPLRFLGKEPGAAPGSESNAEPAPEEEQQGSEQE